MQARPEPHAGAGSGRISLALATALAAATVGSGLALGQRPEAGQAARLVAAAVVPAAAYERRGAAVRGVSTPAAVDAFGSEAAPPGEATPTF
jgi:hypothetical protein